MDKMSHHDYSSSLRFLSLAIVITILTILTIIASSLFGAFFSSYRIYGYLLVIILSIITLITTVLSLSSYESLFGYEVKRLKELDATLMDVVPHTALQTEYIEDRPDGRAYKRLTELVRNAKHSLITIISLEPFTLPEMAPSNKKLRQARHEYYEAIKRQVDRQQYKSKPFYRGIVQMPRDSKQRSFILKSDQELFEYLKYISQLQRSNPRSVVLLETVADLTIQFTIIDERYIFLPITTPIKNSPQIRYGYLIIEDDQGELVKNLEYTFTNLMLHSQPIESNQLETLIKK